MSLLKENHASPKDIRNGLIMLASFVVFALFAYFSIKKKEQIFRERGKITWGTILEVRKGAWIEYQICVNKQYYISSSKLRISLEKGRLLQKRNISIPIIYDSLDPSNTDAMLLKEDFDLYEINYPDSLQEIHQLILNLK